MDIQRAALAQTSTHLSPQFLACYQRAGDNPVQAGEHERSFRPHATIDDVLTWAIKVFGIDANLATEFELERHGQKGELPGAEHVGHVADHHHTLALDLIRGIIANGAGDDR